MSYSLWADIMKPGKSYRKKKRKRIDRNVDTSQEGSHGDLHCGSCNKVHERAIRHLERQIAHEKFRTSGTNSREKFQETTSNCKEEDSTTQIEDKIKQIEKPLAKRLQRRLILQKSLSLK